MFEDYLAHQTPVSQNLFPDFKFWNEPGNVDKFVAIAVQNKEICEKYGVENACWVKREGGAVSFALAPVCPEGFVSIQEAAKKAATSSPKMVEYARSSRAFLAAYTKSREF
jgi:hypothetical protein